MQSRTMQTIQAILYELQPFRIIDLVDFLKYLSKCSDQLIVGLKSLSAYTTKSTMSSLTKTSGQYYLKIFLWLLGWWLFVKAEFGSLWIIGSLFAAIFLNLGEKKAGDLSAYSVFNDGFQQLLGTMNAEQFDNEIRHRVVDDWDDEPIGNNNRNNNLNNNGRNNQQNNQARKKGKKARRNYEERVARRELEQRHLREAFGLEQEEMGEGGDQREFFVDGEEEEWEQFPAEQQGH